MDYTLDAPLRRQLGPARHGALLRRRRRSSPSARAAGKQRRRSRPNPSQGRLSHERRSMIDEVSGVATTGHEWDGIKELNNPLPRWWLWTFYATIVWALGLHRRLSGLAAARRPPPAACSAIPAAATSRTSLPRPKRPRRSMSRPIQSKNVEEIAGRRRRCANSRSPPAAPPSRSIASSATARARRARRLSQPQRRRLAVGRRRRPDPPDDRPRHPLRTRRRDAHLRNAGLRRHPRAATQIEQVSAYVVSLVAAPRPMPRWSSRARRCSPTTARPAMATTARATASSARPT